MVEKDDFLYKPLNEIREIQNANLMKTIQLCAKYQEYCKRIFKQEGLNESDFKNVDDLEKLPLLHKLDYMKEPDIFRLNLPGTNLHERVIWDIAYTSGTTTGTPTPFYNTTHDFYGLLVQSRRSVEIEGVTNDDIIANVYPLTAWPTGAFLTALRSAMIMGVPLVFTLTGTPYPEFPVHNSLERAAKIVERSRATVIWGVTSFVRRLIIEAKEKGIDFTSLRMGILSGEPLPDAMRSDVKNHMRSVGIRDPIVRNRYGFTEIQGSLLECGEGFGCHNPAPDLYYFEIVDEKTGKRLREGEKGLLVLTHLNRRGTVLLRFVIGDVTSMTYETCPNCKRNGGRVILPPVRTQELVKIKGMLINPDLLKQEILSTPGVEEYQIVFTKSDLKDPFSMDQLVVRIATEEENKKRITDELVNKVHTAIAVRPIVEFLKRDEIYDPAKSMKSSRIVDLRPKGQ
ncbi:MAG: AMP-binding protein [Thermodesulfobacteriota bacterium]|nr:AMP-binding protein [Thermodesulfobacteriota bacterium]